MINRIADIQASHDHPSQSWKGTFQSRPPLYSPLTHVEYGLSYLQPFTAVDICSGLHQSLKAGYSKDKDFGQLYNQLMIKTAPPYLNKFLLRERIIYYTDYVFLSCIGSGSIFFMTIMMHLLLDILVFTSHTTRLQESGLNLVRMSKTTLGLALLANRTRILPIDVTDFHNLGTFLPKGGTPSL
jgi:hypothetical protein